VLVVEEKKVSRQLSEENVSSYLAREKKNHRIGRLCRRGKGERKESYFFRTEECRTVGGKGKKRIVRGGWGERGFMPAPGQN